MQFPVQNTECHYYSPRYFPNKCGSKSPKYKFIYHLIPNLALGTCCNCHDYAYHFGGCKKIDDTARYRADKEFYLDMKHRIDKFYFWRRWYYYGIIDLYYKAVRKFGHTSFNWFDNEEEFITHKLKFNYIVNHRD